MTLTFRTALALIAVSTLCLGQAASDVSAPATSKSLPSAPVGTKGSGSSAPVKTSPDMPEKAAISPDASTTDDKTSAPKLYVIGSLDVLSVTVWNDPKLSGFFDVGPDGMIHMPLIGEMRADGLTVNQLTSLITKKLSATVMEDPEVNVQVARINSKKFYIYGGCARQGEFPLTGNMTFMDAFANCGGFKDFVNQKKIYILRGTEQIPFNYKDVSRGRHMEQNRQLLNGDRIFVPE